MSDQTKLSRRERQIMDILYAKEEATVLEIQEKLPDSPTPMAIRRMVQILEEKGLVLLMLRSSASTRHVVWVSTLGALLLLPFLSRTLPK